MLFSAMAFELHPRLAGGGTEVGRLGGCRILLKDQALFPWVLVVPEVEGIEDLHELPAAQYGEVMAVVRRVSEFVSTYFQPEKLNVASIGNQVRQLHVHVVGRSVDDAAWPGTVWAHKEKMAYAPERVREISAAACEFLQISSL